MENREAGYAAAEATHAAALAHVVPFARSVIIGEGGEHLIEFAMQVYNSDWDQATKYVVGNTYTKAELAVIQNPYVTWPLHYSHIAIRRCALHQRWNSSWLEPLCSRAKQAVIIPPARDYKGAYVTPTPYAAASETTVIYTSPDYARYELFRDLNSTHSKFELFMYQVRADRGRPRSPVGRSRHVFVCP